MKIIIIFILIFCSQILYSTNNDKIKLYEYGFNISYLSLNHFADFKELNEVKNCCPSFSNANGNGISLGLFYSEKLFSRYNWSLGLSLQQSNGIFLDSETLPSFNFETNDIKNAEIKYSLQSESIILGLNPNIFFNYNDFNISFGLNFNFQLLSQFSYYSNLNTLPGYTFANNEIKRNNITGNINNINLILLEPVFSISYDIPLNNTFTYSISPEIKVSYLLNNVISDNKWKYFSIYFGFSFKKLRFDKYDTPLRPLR